MRPRWYSVIAFCVSGLLIALYNRAWYSRIWPGPPLIPRPWDNLLLIVGCVLWTFALLTYSRTVRPRCPTFSRILIVFALIAGIGNLVVGIAMMLLPLFR